MIVPQGQPDLGGDSLAVLAPAFADSLPQRLQGLEARAAPGGADPHALRRAVVEDAEHRGVTLAGEGRRRVGFPHHVGLVGNQLALRAGDLRSGPGLSGLRAGSLDGLPPARRANLLARADLLEHEAGSRGAVYGR